MSFQDIINQMGIEMLVFAVCMFFGLRLIITRDVSIIKKEDPESIRHPKEYTLYAGILLLFMGVAALVMGIVSFFNPIAAVIVIVISVLIMGIAWKFMHEKYA
ncbi:MAG: hypothetical protein IJU77_12415 [Butyrivibrio sp.]|nr:hypothetical protein [Butyrivibrio sp.]